MALIKDRKVAPDNWQLLERALDGAAPVVPATGEVIVDLSVWRELRARLVARQDRVGVWLDGAADPADIAPDLEHLALVAVRFESFTDGRGYSIGRLLRERYGWRGELRAIGDVQRDQLYYLARCGFNAFSLREGEDVEFALTAFNDFTQPYQAAVDQPTPLFRRREIAAPHA
ncbi:MAG: DUF934 domain-containing protein [Pseudomonadota bacterium]